MSEKKPDDTSSAQSCTSGTSSTDGFSKKRKILGRRKNSTADGWEQYGSYKNAQRQKMQKQNSNFSKDADGSVVSPDIFSHVAVYIDGYTKPSSDELKKLVLLHGGRYEHYMAKRRVTHIIATNLAESKKKNFKGMKIVKPEWITESVKSGKLLSYIPYQLYTAQSGNQEGLSSYTVPVNNTDMSSVSYAESLTSGCHSDVDPPSTINEESHSIDFQDDTGDAIETEDSTLLTTESLKGDSPQQDGASSRHFPKSGDSNFLSEFYTHSRLHHLSTWGAEFREYVNHLVTTGDTSFPGKERLKEHIRSNPNNREKSNQRTIMHVDMDCFFVSVGLKKRPDLRGKPVAVTHSRNKGNVKESPSKPQNCENSPNKLQNCDLSAEANVKTSKESNNSRLDDSLLWISESSDEEDFTTKMKDLTKSELPSVEPQESFYSRAEIASCSYEARKAGVKNGMFMGEAKKLCPAICTIPYDFDEYNKVSRILYDTVASYTHTIEAVSCDEMLVDCTELLTDTGATPLEFASLLRQEIFEKTGCTASAGLASNILLAKLATRSAKPNGQHYLSPSDVDEFIAEQSIRNLPGVGWALTSKLKSMGITTCGDLKQIALSSLQKDFGPKTGQSLFKCARGQDDRPIKIEKERKSVSAEINYGIRFEKNEEVEKFIEELSAEVHNRLEKIKMKGKAITLKIMLRRQDAPKEASKFMGHGLCNNISKSSTLPLATDDTKIISKECLSIYHRLKLVPSDLRGMGIQVTKLEKLDFGPNSGPGSILNFIVPKNSLQHSSTSSSTTPASEVKLPAYVTKIDDLMDIGFRPSAVDGGKQLRIHSKVIIDELKRRAASNRIQPPLPTLPDFDSTDNSELTLVTSDRDKCDAAEYLLSPSQVDGEVLKELPLEIREQIELVMKKNRESSIVSISVPCRSPSVMPGCSHWMKESTAAEDVHHTGELRNQMTQFNGPGGTSLQIDREVLKELPLEIREQIEADMETQYQSSRDFEMNQPVARIREPTPAIKPVENICVPPDTVSSNDPIEKSSAASLCGAVSLESVKEMISEWLDSSADPVDDDLDIIKSYFSQLIAFKNLEQLMYILKFIYRKISRMENSSWYKVWEPLLTEVQSSVMLEYGYKLKLHLRPMLF